MIIGIMLAIVLGVLGGFLWLEQSSIPLLDTILMSALSFIVFVAGSEIGGNRHILKKIWNPQGIVLMLAIPVAVIVGSLVGGTLFGTAVGLAKEDALLVSAGLGWYSLSSVVISAMYSVELGTISFLTNALRETLSFGLIPLVARYNKVLSIGIGGACTMDSTLPVIIKYTNLQIGILGFVNGLVLTLLVPFLLSALMPV
ncbi:MAG TPA: lysine exporter LysO family protein [Candidatus Avacidaminococcus intestinavium]|uniref:Lysine exporter LysO family protein n=1 Tax=Candidatus Avacidaminococcus intestinavium TaxID=2840684 RepID=A0A9D1MNX2_9FIRM|nr:lysine exporter LysO family protein [Candidatus Avacidaminococcus intestinavium]